MELTVGRIVHYLPGEGREPWAGLVCSVKPDGSGVVSLFVFAVGTEDGAARIQWLPDIPEGTTAGHWTWPPRV